MALFKEGVGNPVSENPLGDICYPKGKDEKGILCKALNSRKDLLVSQLGCFRSKIIPVGAQIRDRKRSAFTKNLL